MATTEAERQTLRSAALDVFNAECARAKATGVQNYRRGAWNVYLCELARIKEQAAE